MQSLQQLLRTKVLRDANDVWHLSRARDFSYSDGAAIEHYIAYALRTSRDLSSTSVELEGHIRNWPSEYHLSRARSLLLRGFQIPASATVLEVGCGAGAITRYLGECCSRVVAVEGSPTRAALARVRCRELSNVSVVCAPFEELEFAAKFDVVVCVGVLEYAATFGRGNDPYEQLLSRFSALLAERGSLLLAIENQLGLKYFAGAREDHTARRFEGIEGYPASGHRVQTFGRVALHKMMRRHFTRVDFFYPYPDYKLPRCVLSDKAHRSLDVAELVGSYRSRDYAKDDSPLFDEVPASRTLMNNAVLPDFSHSFLVAAGRDAHDVKFPQLGVVYSLRANPAFDTTTTIEATSSSSVRTIKRVNSGATYHGLSLRDVTDAWADGPSVHTQITARLQRADLPLAQALAPAARWLSTLRARAETNVPAESVPGEYFDAIWKNAFTQGDECAFIDLEWRYHESLPLTALVARACDCFLTGVGARAKRFPRLARASRWGQMRSMARALGVTLLIADLHRYAYLERQRALAVDSRNTLPRLRQYARMLLPAVMTDAARWVRNRSRGARRLEFELRIRIRYHLARLRRTPLEFPKP